jgi:hypothetical protein
VDHHPCHFVYVCAQPFLERGNLRRALHISHVCPESLVDAIEFETYLPPETTYGDYLEHFDSNGSCTLHEDGERLKCSSLVNTPKLAPGKEPGNDDAWLLPEEYNDGDYPWGYKYNVFLQDPGNDAGQPFSDIPGAEFSPGDVFGGSGGSGVPSDIGGGSTQQLPHPMGACTTD